MASTLMLLKALQSDLPPAHATIMLVPYAQNALADPSKITKPAGMRRIILQSLLQVHDHAVESCGAFPCRTTPQATEWIADECDI